MQRLEKGAVARSVRSSVMAGPLVRMPVMVSVWSLVIWSVEETPLSVLVAGMAGSGGKPPVSATKASVLPPLLPWLTLALGRLAGPA